MPKVFGLLLLQVRFQDSYNLSRQDCACHHQWLLAKFSIVIKSGCYPWLIRLRTMLWWLMLRYSEFQKNYRRLGTVGDRAGLKIMVFASGTVVTNRSNPFIMQRPMTQHVPHLAKRKLVVVSVIEDVTLQRCSMHRWTIKGGRLRCNRLAGQCRSTQCYALANLLCVTIRA